MMLSFFIFGFGYTAEFLAKKLREHNFSVIGTTRKNDRVGHYSNLDYKLISFVRDSIKEHLNHATHVLISTPPEQENGDPVLSNFKDLLIDNARQLQWLGYLSSTSVYGDHQGERVDEDSSPNPLSGEGKVRLETEKAWIEFSNNHQLPLHIFRLSGIYGPGRNALSRILAGKNHSIYKEGHFFSRIHVEDIGSVIMASVNKPNPISIYNLADDEPTNSYIVDEYASLLLNRPALPLVPIEKCELSIMEKGFYSSNRRISNAKIKNELGIQLKYSSYKEGLKALSF